MLHIFGRLIQAQKGALVLATSWTTLLFLLCFLPGYDIPDVDVPFIDKWTHFVLFGVFSFLWLAAYPGADIRRLVTCFLASCVVGWLVEEIQGLLTFLSRTKDVVDIVADAVGGLLGVLFFGLCYRAWLRRQP